MGGMARWAWVDGRTVETWQLPATRPYVTERVHTIGYRARRIDEHLAVMRAASETMFGFSSILRAGEAERIAAGLLARNAMTRTLSCPVRLRLTAKAELIVECEEPTFGAGCYLRAMMPAAASLRYDVPPWDCRSSMNEEIASAADRIVCMSGADTAIRIDSDDMVVGRPWSPLFLVRERYVFTPCAYASVEYAMAVEAIARSGLSLHVRRFTAQALEYADELFTVDVMGMTAYSRIDGRRLSSTMAARVASFME